MQSRGSEVTEQGIDEWTLHLGEPSNFSGKARRGLAVAEVDVEVVGKGLGDGLLVSDEGRWKDCSKMKC